MSYAGCGGGQEVRGALTSVGVKPGDRVALMAPNVPQWIAAYYSILKVGA